MTDPHTPVENRDPSSVVARVQALRAEQDGIARRLDAELERLGRRTDVLKRARDAVGGASEACRTVLYLREVAMSYRRGLWPAEVHTALERVADGLERREKDRSVP